MKLKFFFITLQTLMFLKAQNSGLINYSITVNENVINKKAILEKDRSGYLVLINNTVKEYSNQFHYTLKLSENESLFKLENSMNSDKDNLKFKMAIAFLEAKTIYYTNKVEELTYTKVEAYGQSFILKDSLPNWKLLKETKQIGEYTCYKAVTTRTVINSKGTFVSNVEAWYTPKLVFPFGPKGYGGLPGLILELTEDKITYYASEINTSEKIIKIKKPKNGKLVTRDEFLEIGNKASENRG